MFYTSVCIYKYLIHCWPQVEVFGFILLDRTGKNCKSSKWLFKWRFRTDKVLVVKVHGKYLRLQIQMIWLGKAEQAKKGYGFHFSIFPRFFGIFRNFSKVLNQFDILCVRWNAYWNAIESEKSISKEKQIDNMASVLQSQVNQILSQQALSRHWLAKSRNMFDRITD